MYMRSVCSCRKPFVKLDMAHATSALLTLSTFVFVCSTGTDAKLLSRRLLTNTCTDWSPSFGQCGGQTCPDGSGSHCSDTAYKCCPSDNTCQRQNQWYWQCLPGSHTSATESAAPTETPSVPESSTPMPARAFQSHVVTQPANTCMVAGNNADYPNGLQCHGYLSFPACCQGPNCSMYQFWDASGTNTAWLRSTPGGELASESGACRQDFTLGCCPAVPSGQ